MLRQFLSEHREELITRMRKKAAARLAPRASDEDVDRGIPLFFDQLVETLQLDEVDSKGSRPNIRETAAKNGADLLRIGFRVAEVIHGYSDVVHAISELAVESNAPISTEELQTLNRGLDAATAGAVTEYARQREESSSDQELERLGFLAHELRNLVSSALLAYQMLKTGSVAGSGRTGEILGRSLMAMRALIDRTLAKVRLEAGIERRARVRLSEFIEDVEVSASMEAQAHGIHLTVDPIDETAFIDVDRQILASAASNLLQNAFKFSRRQGHVRLRVHRSAGRILIEIEDECGGLPTGMQRELFRPFKPGGGDVRIGMGLGLSISREAVRANGGDIHVRNLPGKGCIFAIDLPMASDG